MSLIVAALLAAGSMEAQTQAARRAEELKKFGRGEGRLRPGDAAPEFRLKQLHADTEVALAGFHGQKPVALVFGSFT